MTLNVYEGVVDVAIPVTPNAEVFHRTNADRPEVVNLPISVLYQVCSETVCYVPRTEVLSLEVPFESLLPRDSQ